MGDSLQSINIENLFFYGSSQNKENLTPSNQNAGTNFAVESVDLSSIGSKSTENKSSDVSDRVIKIQSYIDQQVVDPNETVNSIDEMEAKMKRDIKVLEDRAKDAKEKTDSLKKSFEYANSDISVFSDALPDDKKWIERYGMTKKEYQDMIDKMSEYVGMLNQTIKSDKELLKKMPYFKMMDTKDFSDYVSNYKSNWQSFVNYDEVAEQYSYGHNLKTYTKLDGKDVDWMAVIEYMLAKDKNLVIGEHDELRDTYLKYEAMDESQRMMYHYLFEKEGVDSANKYLDAIADDINKNIALNRVERKIKSMASSYKLDKNGHITQASIDATLENLVASYGAGFDEALKGNYAGLFKYGKDNYTVEEYEQMYFLQYLEQNGMLQNAYDAGSTGGTISNMGVSMALFTGATFLSGGTASAAVVPYVLQTGNVALSVANTGGNANHYALMNGASQEVANQYTASIVRNNLISQLTSAIVTKGVGSTTQFLTALNGTNALGLSGNLIVSSANVAVGATTAAWEVGQEQALKSALLNEKPLDLDTANGKMLDAFVSNIIMGALSEVPGVATSYYSIKTGDKVFEFSSEDCLEYFRKNPKASKEDFIKSYSGDFVIDPNSGKIIKLTRLDEDFLEKQLLDSSTNKNNNSNNNSNTLNSSKNGYQSLSDWSDAVMNFKYQKEIDGITFSSDTEQGLQNLISYYKVLRSRSNKTTAVYFREQLRGKGLYITDVSNDLSDNGAFHYRQIIHLDPLSAESRTFYHEAGHFIDTYVLKYDFTGVFYDFVNTMKNKSRAEIYNLIDKFMNDYDNRVKDFNKSFDDEIDFHKNFLKRKFPDFDSFSEDKQKYLLNKYRKDKEIRYCSGYIVVSDIFDAITDGKMFDLYGYPGHGRKYYTSNDYAGGIESLAQLSVLYNTHMTSLLYKYFSADEVNNIIFNFEEMINLEALSDKINSMSNGNSCTKNILDYLESGNVETLMNENGFRDYVSKQTRSTLLTYLNSYNCLANYFDPICDRIDNENGVGTVKKYINEYLKSGNLTVIPDDELRNFLKYMSMDRIKSINMII